MQADRLKNRVGVPVEEQGKTVKEGLLKDAGQGRTGC